MSASRKRQWSIVIQQGVVTEYLPRRSKLMAHLEAAMLRYLFTRTQRRQNSSGKNVKVEHVQ